MLPTVTVRIHPDMGTKRVRNDSFYSFPSRSIQLQLLLFFPPMLPPPVSNVVLKYFVIFVLHAALDLADDSAFNIDQ